MDSVTLEVRPRLRSLNAYISLEKNIDSTAIKVKLLEDTIEIQIEDKIYKLPLCNIKLLPSSLSSLGITNRWISFRIQTQPSSLYGTFQTEIINTENELLSSAVYTPHTVKLPPKNVDCKLLCDCCKNEITKNVNFKRILPMPSSDCDPQEWFCCKHDGDDPFSLDPKESDLFYSTNYLILNKHVFQENLKLRNSLVHCNRCLSILGSSNVKEPNNLKIWNCCIEYQMLENTSDVNIKGSLSPLEDFLSTIKQIADLTAGEKLFLEAQDAKSTHYIVLRPMEAKLNIFTENKISQNDQILNLESSFVVKVLYKYGESEKPSKSDDSDTKFCELAVPSILAGMDHLVTSSVRFPPAYRRAEDFYIGYLYL